MPWNRTGRATVADALSGIYDQLLLQHIRDAHHYGLRTDVAALLEISNPLCGDVLQLQLAWEHGQLAELRFTCECCGIAMGNASLMTDLLPGLDAAAAAAVAAQAVALLRGVLSPQAVVSALIPARQEQAAAAWALLYEIGQRLPARRTCASLAWQALVAALDGQSTCDARELR